MLEYTFSVGKFRWASCWLSSLICMVSQFWGGDVGNKLSVSERAGWPTSSSTTTRRCLTSLTSLARESGSTSPLISPWSSSCRYYRQSSCEPVARKGAEGGDGRGGLIAALSLPVGMFCQHTSSPWLCWESLFPSLDTLSALQCQESAPWVLYRFFLGFNEIYTCVVLVAWCHGELVVLGREEKR